MTNGVDRSSLRRRLEPGRLFLGFLAEWGIKAYGAGAATSVALGDAETLGGKLGDAAKAVPNLMDEYRHAKYVADHREEIGAAIDYLNHHTPPQAELTDAADRGAATLDGINTTYDEVARTIDALPFSPIDAVMHAREAWAAKPDLDSIRHLADLAEQVSPALDQVDVLIPVYYGGLVALMDNFAADEIVSTVIVMTFAFGLSVVLGQVVGFWVRRGRPGLLARMLQSLGARRFRGWYVQHLPETSPALYDAASERLQRDLVADPERVLDAETLRELELYFRSRDPDAR